MPFLGANRTALIAGWGQQAPQFISLSEVTSTFQGGIGGYPANVTSHGLQSVTSGYTYDTSGGTSVWGVFTAVTLYIPSSVFQGYTDLANTNNNSTQVTMVNTEINDTGFYEGIGLRINSGQGNTSAVNTFTFDPRFTGGTSWATALNRTVLQDRWITVITSLYDTSSNYNSWSPPSGATGDVYGRMVIADTETSALISQQDQIFVSNTNMFNYFKSNIAYSTSNPTLQYSTFNATGALVVNPWVHFGDTIDPGVLSGGNIYTQWLGFHTPAPGPRPVFNCVQRSTADYTTSGGVVYIANNSNARMTAANGPISSNNLNVQGTLSYL